MAKADIVIDTPRTILVPRQVVTLDNAAELLRLAGKGCRKSEQSVCSELQEDIVAVMAIERERLTQLIERWGSEASFSSPLLDMRHSEERCLTIDTTEDICYMRHFDGGLQRAEAYEMSSSEDVLYYATEWLTDIETPIYIKGNSGCAKLLRKYFKRVICE